MKRLIICLLLVFAGLAQAQSVNWPAAWAGCAADARAYDAQSESEGLGGKLTSRKVQINFEEGAGSPPTVAGLQDNIQEARKVLANPKDWTLLIQIGSRMGLCGSLAALKQLETGSKASSTLPGNVVTQRKPEPRDDNANCVFVSPVRSTLYSECSKRVSLGWCFIPNDRSEATNILCEEQRFGQQELDPGGEISLQKNAVVAWTYCKAPTRLTDLRYFPDRRLVDGKCRR
ncbi:hypothetical protein [Hydrogenophaga sp. MI9]|uniref:hypothetical protein n=1 Tax=Hydrogenophaga sp. MI9 TaxID=3453719 RepID=UPI003EEFC0F6